MAEKNPRGVRQPGKTNAEAKKLKTGQQSAVKKLHRGSTQTIRSRAVASDKSKIGEQALSLSAGSGGEQKESILKASARLNSEKNRPSEDSVRRAFLFVFIAAFSFVLGTGVGNQRNQSLVDSAIEKLLESAPNELDKSELERAAIEGAVKASGDEWANYFPQSTLAQLNQITSNTLTGIGVSITEARSGAIRVSDVQEDSIAARSGIQIGDQILRVNGVDVQSASATAVAAQIRGEIGKEVELAIRRDTEVLEFSLLTEKVDLRTVDYSQIDSNVAFISISSFSTGTAQEVRDALANIRGNRGVIVDLRDNPGGIIEEAVQVAEEFIGRGVLVSYKVNGDERIFSASNPEPNPAPVVLLINKRTTSAAELLAAAFQDRNRGVVIGERSYGKGSVQEFVTLRDGSKLELTVALYLTPSGRTIEGVGVTPDLLVPESDLAIKALQILGGLSELTSKSSK